MTERIDPELSGNPDIADDEGWERDEDAARWRP